VTGNNIIGTATAGDEIVFLGVDGPWYLIRLGEHYKTGTFIQGGSGWISAQLVSPPAVRPPLATPAISP
jgi:hypothetical protein